MSNYSVLMVHAVFIKLATTPTHATANLSPTDDSSCNTQSCTGGDSGFSDSQAFLKESPYSSPHQNSQCHERPEHSRTSLITSAAANEHTGYYNPPNPESRIEGRIYYIVGVIYYLQAIKILLIFQISRVCICAGL